MPPQQLRIDWCSCQPSHRHTVPPPSFDRALEECLIPSFLARFSVPSCTNGGVGAPPAIHSRGFRSPGRSGALCAKHGASDDSGRCLGAWTAPIPFPQPIALVPHSPQLSVRIFCPFACTPRIAGKFGSVNNSVQKVEVEWCFHPQAAVAFHRRPRQQALAGGADVAALQPHPQIALDGHAAHAPTHLARAKDRPAPPPAQSDVPTRGRLRGRFPVVRPRGGGGGYPSGWRPPREQPGGWLRRSDSAEIAMPSASAQRTTAPVPNIMAAVLGVGGKRKGVPCSFVAPRPGQFSCNTHKARGVSQLAADHAAPFELGRIRRASNPPPQDSSTRWPKGVPSRSIAAPSPAHQMWLSRAAGDRFYPTTAALL